MSKHTFVQLRDTLLDLRQKCIETIDAKYKTLSDENGEVSELISIAENMEMLKKVKNELREIEKETLKKQKESANVDK